ncbi:ferric reductase-like transmembrane domain-containing protein [Sutcliffiella horikoshii]|uniref:ferric reductase-like transmembrane domain-containing protein n=1 Tax=Sutcliffiella horikoshii TaxID=79883 RepID=UPI001F39DBD0|nr:hypothetical protein [Sutcliffiella horikoshii]
MKKITASFRSSRQHAIVGISSLLACYILVQTRHDIAPLHSWNRAFADVSLFMLALVLILGPLSHFHKPLQKQIVWRRPIGIWSAIHAGLHTIIILDGWVEWKFERLFFIFTPPGQPWILHPGFALANTIGILALGYYLILTASSNDWSVKLLGVKSWKYLQQKATVLYTLIILHTLYFLFLHEPENPNWFKVPFVILLVLIFVIRVSAFLKIAKGKSLKKVDE